MALMIISVVFHKENKTKSYAKKRVVALVYIFFYFFAHLNADLWPKDKWPNGHMTERNLTKRTYDRKTNDGMHITQKTI